MARQYSTAIGRISKDDRPWQGRRGAEDLLVEEIANPNESACQ